MADKGKCMHCKEEAISRGCCRGHYNAASNAVRRGATWEMMEEMGLVARSLKARNGKYAKVFRAVDTLIDEMNDSR